MKVIKFYRFYFYDFVVLKNIPLKEMMVRREMCFWVVREGVAHYVEYSGTFYRVLSAFYLPYFEMSRRTMND